MIRGKGMDGVIASRFFWESINIVLLWGALGMIWCPLTGTVKHPRQPAELSTSVPSIALLLWELRVMPLPPWMTSHRCPCLLVSSTFWFSSGLLFHWCPPKLELVCVCHPQDPGNLPGCPHPALSALSKTLTLTEGWPLYQQTIHLIQELSNLESSPKSVLDLGSPAYRLLIVCYVAQLMIKLSLILLQLPCLTNSRISVLVTEVREAVGTSWPGVWFPEKTFFSHSPDALHP